MDIAEKLSKVVSGDVSTDSEILSTHSRDTSIFSKTPSHVVFPKHDGDVSATVRLVSDLKKSGVDVSVTARSAGTDMTGGPLSESVVLSFTKYMNHCEAHGDHASVEPGCYYRDFEKETLAHGGYLLPSYPASRNLCALGGIVSNDSAGEMTLKYGKTHDYVDSLEVVLADGTHTTVGPLSLPELEAKKRLQTFEGDIYRKMDALLTKYTEIIEHARPTVSKNSAGFALWRVKEKKGIFDLSQIITGSQGTLALITKAYLRLIQPKKHKTMLVVFLKELDVLPEIVNRVLKHNPESFESYDNHTFSLAVQFLPQMLRQMGLKKMFRLGFAFLPEVWTVATSGVPKMVVMAEFAEDTQDEALEKARAALHSLTNLPVRARLAGDALHAEKYWIVRRESFALLRKNLKGMYAAPFIDDFVVHPNDYPTFLPELNAILNKYNLVYTIAGHIGNGNFHIIPLMDLSKPETRTIITELSPQVYELVTKYNGSITGEHNDGIIRTPYLEMMFGTEVCSLFEETKAIFDPLNILNPGKKVGGTFADIEKYMVHK